jgi:hypothetical protein
LLRDKNRANVGVGPERVAHMIVDQNASQVLPPAVQAVMWQLAEQMWAAVSDGASSPAQAEEQVARLSRQVGQEVLAAGLSARYGLQRGPRRPCACGLHQRFEGYRARAIMTVLGAVRYRRAYYRCRDCGAVHYAGEDVLGLHGGVFSLPAQEAISLVCSEVPFERARVLLQRLSGLRCCVSQAEELTQAHGQRLLAQQQHDCEQLFAGTLEPVPEQRDHRLYVTLDATRTRFRDDWHETRVGAIYDAVSGDDGLDQPQRTTTVACAWQDLNRFGQHLYQEAARRGLDHAREVVVVADGAPWIWNQAAEHFPQATQILDFYHASERLHTVGRAVYGDGTKRARAWAEHNVGRLSAGGWKGLLCSLKALRPHTVEGREAVRTATGYFQTNRPRMNYPAYRARGLHIGSGVVEAACKAVVATRCKRAGMRWSQPGAQAVLSRRTQLLNERWDEYWQPLKVVA